MMGDKMRLTQGESWACPVTLKIATKHQVCLHRGWSMSPPLVDVSGRYYYYDKRGKKSWIEHTLTWCPTSIFLVFGSKIFSLERTLPENLLTDAARMIIFVLCSYIHTEDVDIAQLGILLDTIRAQEFGETTWQKRTLLYKMQTAHTGGVRSKTKILQVRGFVTWKKLILR